VSVVIGFATSCMNRRWQLERTLPHNLDVLRGTGHFLAVVDFGSIDEVADLLESFVADRKSGTLVCFGTSEPTHFEASQAKNTAHRLALRRAPTVLFNLDADNFVTPETLSLVEEVFADGPEPVLHNLWPNGYDGSFGRIALLARTWQRLGGYDETLGPIAWQDIDLLYRCRAMGLVYRQDERGLRPPVPNDLAEKMVNVDLPDSSKPGSPRQRYESIWRKNLLRSLARGPACLPFGDQKRFDGILDFAERAVI
jgi:hypothetical protein